MNWLAIGAFLLDCGASFLVAVSYIAMKKGFIKVENSGLNGTKRQNPYLTCQWISGFLILIVGSVIHVVVLPFVDLVILSAGTSIAIVMNTLLSVLYLGEKFVPRYDVTAFSLIIGGSLIICLISDYSETTFTPERIRELMSSAPSIIFMLFQIIVAIIAFLQYQWHKR